MRVTVDIPQELEDFLAPMSEDGRCEFVISAIQRAIDVRSASNDIPEERVVPEDTLKQILEKLETLSSSGISVTAAPTLPRKQNNIERVNVSELETVTDSEEEFDFLASIMK